MNPVQIVYLLIITLQLLPAYAWGTDTPASNQDLSPEDVLEMFGNQGSANQGSANDGSQASTTPDTTFTPVDDSLFDTGVTNSAPPASNPGISAEQLRREVQSAGALRERTGTQTNNFGQSSANDQYRLRQQVQELQRYVREQDARQEPARPVPPPQEPWNYEVPGNSPPYSAPVDPFSQTP